MNIKEHLIDLQQRAADRANSDAEEIERLRELVANDAYAASFQSMKQYRNALLSALAGKEKENV